MKSKRSKACDISQAVKERVWERDGGKCVICQNEVNVMPNAHYIPRSRGGLGIEENIVTLCTNFTEKQCHRRYDSSTEREILGEQIKAYLMKHYPNWDESKLYYRKGNL